MSTYKYLVTKVYIDLRVRGARICYAVCTVYYCTIFQKCTCTCKCSAWGNMSLCCVLLEVTHHSIWPYITDTWTASNTSSGVRWVFNCYYVRANTRHTLVLHVLTLQIGNIVTLRIYSLSYILIYILYHFVQLHHFPSPALLHPEPFPLFGSSFLAIDSLPPLLFLCSSQFLFPSISWLWT